MFHRTFKTAALAGCAVAALSTAAAAQELIRVASFTSEKALGVQAMIIPWMEAVEAEVGDQVTLKGFWGGSLGRDPFSQYELVRKGVADIAWVGAGYSPGRFPQLHALELPFMASNGVEASLAGWQLVEDGLIEGLDEFHVITIWTASGDYLHLREPISSPEEISGLRLRTGSAQQAAVIDFMGGVSQTMGPVEVNDALSRGAIDGLVQGYTGMNTFGTFDVTSTTYEINLGMSPFMLLMSKKKWDSLPPEVQASMDKHGGAALAELGGLAYDTASAQIRERAMADPDYTITTPSQEELDALRTLIQPIYEKWISETDNGQAVFDAYTAYLTEMRDQS